MTAAEIFPGGLSPFRTGFLKVALFLGGTWVDVPMTELEDDGVTITRAASEGGRLTFTLKDPTGKWSPRHPASPYYGLIGRGTPVRVQVEHAAGDVRDRYYGEVVTWQPRWTKTGSRDARVDVEAAGAIRRLAQGQSPLRSPLYRAISAIGGDLVGYWPMEDGSDARQFAVAVGSKPMTITGSPSPGAYAGFASSEPIPTLEDARLNATVPTYTPTSPAVAQVRWVGRIPAGTPNGAVLLRVKASGTLGYAEVRYVTAGGGIDVAGVNDAGVSVGTGGYAFAVNGRLLRFSLSLTQSGADIAWSFGIYEPGASGGSFGGGTFTGVTLGRVLSVEVNPNRTALPDVAFGHLAVERAITDLFALSTLALAGHAGERADSRVARLCAESGVTASILAIRAGAGAQRMGPQGRDDLLSLLRECEDTDGGMLYEPRGVGDLVYRPGEALYSQPSPVTIPYADNLLLPFEPVEDDSQTRNTVTVRRAGGSSATVQETTGALGTDAVGLYDEDVTLSLEADADALQQAGWRVHLGTHDEARWPTVGLDLAHPVFRANTGLRDQVLGLDLGSRLEVTGIPSWLPPFPVSQIVRAYTERITPHSYRIECECVPARPYRAAYYGAAADRYSADGTVTAGALSTATTTFTVVPPAGVAWTSADGTYPIVINGEVMTVTNVTGGTSFTVVRGVNGVQKVHAAGSAVALADPCYYGL